MTSAQSFPKAARLLRRRDFLRVQRCGRRRSTSHFVVVSAPGEVESARIGLTVSSRVGNAVVRNRIRRLLRELFRTRCTERQGTRDVVVIAKPGAEGLNYGDVVDELEPLLVAALRG